MEKFLEIILDHNKIWFGLIFIVLTLLIALVVTNLVSQGIVQTILLALSEYILVIPLGYIYYTLYKSLKVN